MTYIFGEYFHLIILFHSILIASHKRKEAVSLFIVVEYRIFPFINSNYTEKSTVKNSVDGIIRCLVTDVLLIFLVNEGIRIFFRCIGNFNSFCTLNDN